ncbi:MAG: hypothetical protein PUD81_01705 [Eggerthellales bacterium]|nr:hypothetical protein [Eggerthellales bacterium]
MELTKSELDNREAIQLIKERGALPDVTFCLEETRPSDADFTCEKLEVQSMEGSSGIVYAGDSRDYYREGPLDDEFAQPAHLIIKEWYPLEFTNHLVRNGTQLLLRDDASQDVCDGIEASKERFRRAISVHRRLYQGAAHEYVTVPARWLYGKRMTALDQVLLGVVHDEWHDYSEEEAICEEANDEIHWRHIGTTDSKGHFVCYLQKCPSDEALYYVTDASFGEPLDKAVEKLSFLQRVQVLINLCEALEAIHGMGYLYLDLKPSNVLLAGQDAQGNFTGSVKLFDFDTVLSFDEAKDADVPLTNSGNWSAYEQTHLGYRDTLCPASDLYALGAMLFWFMIGRAPLPVEVIHFDGDWALSEACYEKLRSEGIDSRIKLCINRILGKTLTVEAMDRYQSGSEMRADLLILKALCRGSYEPLTYGQKRVLMAAAFMEFEVEFPCSYTSEVLLSIAGHEYEDDLSRMVSCGYFRAHIEDSTKYISLFGSSPRHILASLAPEIDEYKKILVNYWNLLCGAENEDREGLNDLAFSLSSAQKFCDEMIEDRLTRMGLNKEDFVWKELQRQSLVWKSRLFQVIMESTGEERPFEIEKAIERLLGYANELEADSALTEK